MFFFDSSPNLIPSPMHLSYPDFLPTELRNRLRSLVLRAKNPKKLLDHARYRSAGILDRIEGGVEADSLGKDTAEFAESDVILRTKGRQEDPRTTWWRRSKPVLAGDGAAPGDHFGSRRMAFGRPGGAAAEFLEFGGLGDVRKEVSMEQGSVSDSGLEMSTSLPTAAHDQILTPAPTGLFLPEENLDVLESTPIPSEMNLSEGKVVGENKSESNLVVCFPVVLSKSVKVTSRQLVVQEAVTGKTVSDYGLANHERRFLRKVRGAEDKPPDPGKLLIQARGNERRVKVYMMPFICASARKSQITFVVEMWSPLGLEEVANSESAGSIEEHRREQ